MNEENIDRKFEPWYRLTSPPFNYKFMGKWIEKQELALVNPVRNINIQLKDYQSPPIIYTTGSVVSPKCFSPSLYGCRNKFTKEEKELVSSYYDDPENRSINLEGMSSLGEYTLLYLVGNNEIPEEFNLYFSNPFPLALAILDDQGNLLELRNRHEAEHWEDPGFSYLIDKKRGLDKEVISFMKEFIRLNLEWLVKMGAIDMSSYIGDCRYNHEYDLSQLNIVPSNIEKLIKLGVTYPKYWGKLEDFLSGLKRTRLT